MNYTLKYLEEEKEKERKKYRLDEQEIIAWRKGIKKVSNEEANTIAAELYRNLKDKSFNDLDNGMLNIIKYLIESGANLNYKDSKGDSILIYCIYENFINVASMLLSYGADPNITDKIGMTPVGIACKLCQKEFLKLLIYNGADINKRFINGNIAINEVFTSDGSFINSTECLEILLKNNAIINNTNLCNQGLKDYKSFDILSEFGIDFQEKRSKKIDYQKLLQEAKSELKDASDNIEQLKDVKKLTFKRIQ